MDDATLKSTWLDCGHPRTNRPANNTHYRTPLIRLSDQLGATLPSSLASRQDPSCLIVPLLQGSISLEVVPTHPASTKVSKAVVLWLPDGQVPIMVQVPGKRCHAGQFFCTYFPKISPISFFWFRAGWQFCFFGGQSGEFSTFQTGVDTPLVYFGKRDRMKGIGYGQMRDFFSLIDLQCFDFCSLFQG